MIACEDSHDENADPTGASTEAVDESLNLGIEVVRSLLGEARETYATMQVASVVPLTINRCNLLAMLEQREETYYETFVKKSVEQIAEIALLTLGQAAVDRFVISAAFMCFTACCAFYTKWHILSQMAPRAEAPHHKHDGPPHQNEEDRV
ncbi:hypothetical protein HPB48_022487 [Haemaphysalis longicornis]|uniref:Uncharacterized protein n=1 Tax=Haemaphysalis longicornis TaxID=44386 RepID=A0A9J6H5X6_HAELO|nr:hypothetical protein HPB48_022487 [Haemaphysalis longicornis]